MRLVLLALFLGSTSAFWYKELNIPPTRWKNVASDKHGIRWFAVEENGYLWTSPNGTRGWVQTIGPKNWTDVTTDDTGVKIVAVADDIWSSVDGGSSWGSPSLKDTWQGVTSSARGSKVYAIT